jgi:hypothetical protein
MQGLQQRPSPPPGLLRATQRSPGLYKGAYCTATAAAAVQPPWGTGDGGSGGSGSSCGGRSRCERRQAVHCAVGGGWSNLR